MHEGSDDDDGMSLFPHIVLASADIFSSDLSTRTASGPSGSNSIALRRRRRSSGDGPRIGAAKSMDRVIDVATSVFVLGSEPTQDRRLSTASQHPPAMNNLPFLSRQATVGRNSQFRNLTSRDRELLGGIEYRSLKLLLKVVLGE